MRVRSVLIALALLVLALPGFAKDQIVDDPEILEAVKGHKQFIKTSAAPAPTPPVIDLSPAEAKTSKRKTKKKKGDK